MALHKKGQLAQANTMYEQLLAKQPDNFDAQHLMGVIALQNNVPELAAELIGRALAIDPNQATALNNLGNALRKLNRPEQALTCYDKAIALKVGHAEAHNNRGAVLLELGRRQEALTSFSTAIVHKPDYVSALRNHGEVLFKLNRYREALTSLEKAMTLKPDDAEAFSNHGNVLYKLNRLAEALISVEKAVAIKPGYADAHYNRGVFLEQLSRPNEALASYDKAIALKPDYVEALDNRGGVLRALNRHEESLASYAQALAVEPDFEFLLGSKLHARMLLCDWRDLSNEMQQLEVALAENQKVSIPFSVLALMDRPDLQWQASRIHVEAKHPGTQFLGEFSNAPAEGKIRIGYFSADFYNHATSYLMAELFEAHDSETFEIYGFSFGSVRHDEMRERISAGFDHFFDVSGNADLEVVQMARDLGIEIAVDLKGFTKDSRTGIFAERCAPIQVNYLGYPGTMAAPYIDYIVADHTLIPQHSQQYYSEKVVYLPHSYQVNDAKRRISDRVFTRQEAGLPDVGFVFCCFNNSYKILPATFDGRMRILKAVSGSVLWLMEDSPKAARNLRREAEIRGVDSSRLVFAKRVNMPEHLARHRLADVFIDTLPCNAHTTASDALWAGLPVLTVPGSAFAARVAASLLGALDLPELIAETQAQYESRAIELARNPAMLAAIKDKLERNRQSSALFNGQVFARHLEAAYTQMSERQRRGLRPEHIYVDA